MSVILLFYVSFGFGVINAPPGVNIKVPFQGKNMERNISFCYFYDFLKLKSNKNDTKMITSCSVSMEITTTRLLVCDVLRFRT